MRRRFFGAAVFICAVESASGQKATCGVPAAMSEAESIADVIRSKADIAGPQPHRKNKIFFCTGSRQRQVPPISPGRNRLRPIVDCVSLSGTRRFTSLLPASNTSPEQAEEDDDERYDIWLRA